jgi:transcriptional regulator with XRE-family HTH domain
MRTERKRAEARAMGKMLTTLLQKKNLNQTQLAQMTSIHRTLVSKILSGARTPTSAQLVAIADAIEIDIHDLAPAKEDIERESLRESVASFLYDTDDPAEIVMTLPEWLQRMGKHLSPWQKEVFSSRLTKDFKARTKFWSQLAQMIVREGILQGEVPKS